MASRPATDAATLQKDHTNGQPRDSDDDEPVNVIEAEPDYDDENGDARSSSSENDNERVRRKLKNTQIAPGVRAQEKEDEVMSSDSGKDARRPRKRSHDESDPEDKANDSSPRPKHHERKRSRDISDEDAARIGRALNRVKTPPTHAEEDETMQSMTSPSRKLERKRSRGTLGDKEAEDVDQKKKMSRTEEEQRQAGASRERSTNGGASKSTKKTADTKLPPGSGFGNTSSKSPFATSAAGGKPLFGSGSGASSIFAGSKFGAMSGSSVSPFGTLGSNSISQSPFGTLGAKSTSSGFSSTFGSAPSSSTFGGIAAKSGAAKPFGTPDDEKSEDDDEGSNEDDEGGDKEKPADKSETKEGFTEQEVITGEENELTVFKTVGKLFAFDKEEKAWKERGQGTLKLNKTDLDADTSAADFGLESPEKDKKEKGVESPKRTARFIMRKEGTYTMLMNVPLYAAQKMAEPKDSRVSFLAPESGDGTMVLFMFRCKSAAIAKELYQQFQYVHKEVFG